MVFIRGSQPEAMIRRHFRGDGDAFAFSRRGSIHEAVILVNADRAVDLFLALMEHLDPAVRLEIDDFRSGTRWHGHDLALVDVTDAVARLKATLAMYAGVEVAIVADDDQLTLTANLELFIYSRTDRWLYLLQGKGLRRAARLQPRSWRLARGEFAPAPEASRALQLSVERLGIARVDPPRGR